MCSTIWNKVWNTSKNIPKTKVDLMPNSEIRCDQYHPIFSNVLDFLFQKLRVTINIFFLALLYRIVETINWYKFSMLSTNFGFTVILQPIDIWFWSCIFRNKHVFRCKLLFSNYNLEMKNDLKTKYPSESCLNYVTYVTALKKWHKSAIFHPRK